jgi:predicted O-methyltransferase YrrM
MKSLLHLLKYAANMEPPASQVTEAELQLLLQHSRGARTICEIGCYEARTSVALALRAPEARVFSVDPFCKGRLGIRYAELLARLHRRRTSAKNLVFLRGLSQEVAPTFHEPIDFLFIDADHTYEAVRRDWEDWMPKVVDGGVVALHDCKIAANSPVALGSMRFYAQDLRACPHVRELASADSLVILQVRRAAGSWSSESRSVASS